MTDVGQRPAGFLGHRHRHQPGPGPLVVSPGRVRTTRRTRSGLARHRPGPWPGYVMTYQSDPEVRLPPGPAPGLLPDVDRPRALVRSAPPSPGAGLVARRPDDRRRTSPDRPPAPARVQTSPTQPDVFEIARSTSGSLQGPWRLVGRPDIEVDGGTVENFEFVEVAGRWRLVATSDNLDQPWLFTFASGPDRPGVWLRWSDGYALAVPSEPFNAGPGISSIGFEHANSAFLCATGVSGPSGLPGVCRQRGADPVRRMGHAAIGVARSPDLATGRCRLVSGQTGLRQRRTPPSG